MTAKHLTAEVGAYSSVVGSSVHILEPEGQMAGMIAYMCQTDTLRNSVLQEAMSLTIAKALNEMFAKMAGVAALPAQPAQPAQGEAVVYADPAVLKGAAKWLDVTKLPNARFNAPLYTHPTTPPDSAGLDALFVAAKAEAEKAMRKFPQPNYVISKVAEEAGEVVKAAIHCAEGRETPENVVGEIKQAMAMLIRLYIEGDQVHGLPPLSDALRAKGVR